MIPLGLEQVKNLTVEREREKARARARERERERESNFVCVTD